MLTHLRFLTLLGAVFFTACSKSPKYLDQEPIPPQASMKRIQFSEDFRAELFASEPHVIDPVDMAWDENGKIYVAEMLDYPDDPPAGSPVRSRVRLLEDTDGDGRIDKSTLFADQLLQVSGLHPWRGGIVVGAAPDILYLKDSDGDGKADVREVLWTGFPKVNPEGRITNFKYGIDNWFYAANNGADALVHSPGKKRPEKLMLRGADMRFKVDTLQAERASGPAQFGLTFDDWGNRFITQNTVHLRHVLAPAKYLARAPYLETGPVALDISPDGKGQTPIFPLTKPQQWRVQRTSLRQERYKETNPNRVEHLSGFFTAASGSTVYTGDAWPEDYQGSVFTGDVSANLVRREKLEPQGITFRAVPAKEGVEFLASTDLWFRPAHFANAPDGNLYLIDMYREYIETPESIPEEIKKGLNFWSGDDRGRIYRIVSNHQRKQRPLQVKLGSLSSAELVKLLEETNGWHRTTAQRLLVERDDRSVTPALTHIAEASAYPQARLHALWTLEGMGALTSAHVAKALRDIQPQIREHAARLAEPFLARDPALRSAVLALASDKDPRVRYQLAYTLGEMLDDPRAEPLLARIMKEHGEDRWFRLAILSSVSNRAAHFLETLDSPRAPDVVEQLAQIIGAQFNREQIEKLLLTDTSEPSLRGLAQGLKLANGPRLKIASAEKVFATLLQTNNPAAWECARHFELPKIIAQALKDAGNAKLPIARRALAVRALGSTNANQFLDDLLATNPPSEIQSAAVGALAENSAGADIILSHWATFQAEARTKAIAALATRQEWMPKLLEAVESGIIEPGAMDIATRSRFLENEAYAARAKRAFVSEGSDRAKVLQAYKPALTVQGYPSAGKAVYEEHCARCHSPRKQGSRVGPDLSGVNNKSKEELLLSILDPSYAIEPRFVNFVVSTKKRMMYDGIIANETPGSLSLRGGTEEGDVTLLRKNIAEVRASKISLMPEGLEKGISKQQMADLIAYLRAGL